MLEFKKAGSGYQINGVIMRHDYRILHDMLINGRIGTNEFKERDATYAAPLSGGLPVRNSHP